MSFQNQGHYLPQLLTCEGLWIVKWKQRMRAYAQEIPALTMTILWGIYISGMLIFLQSGNY